MKALTLTRPWPDAILYGGKRIENRFWKTYYPDPILLHASQRWDDASR